MKINGKSVSKPNEVIIPVPRDDGDIIFKAQAVIEMEEFENLCPVPKPPIRTVPGQAGNIPQIKDSKYMKDLDDYSARRIDYIIIKSLEPSNIEWDTVKIDDPETWKNYDKDFKSAFFNDVEITRIINGVMEANSLNEARITEARKRFLASQAQQEKGQSPQGVEPSTTQSGEPVKDSK